MHFFTGVRGMDYELVFELKTNAGLVSALSSLDVNGWTGDYCDVFLKTLVLTAPIHCCRASKFLQISKADGEDVHQTLTVC